MAVLLDPNLPIITDVFREYLKEDFNLTADFLTNLFSKDGIGEELFTNSERILRHPESPVSLLLDHLIKWNKPGTYEAFIQCLRSTGNGFHADFIQGLSKIDESEYRSLCKHIMQAYGTELIRNMSSEDIVPHMYCFIEEERENVFSVVRNSGIIRGNQALLGILFKKGTEGFGQLLEGLRKSGNERLATELAEISSSSTIDGSSNILSPKDVDTGRSFSASSSSYTAPKVDRRTVFEEEIPMDENTSGYDPSSGAQEMSGDDEMQVSDDGIQPIKLFRYQKELVASALKGMNSVIVAPTGSGKTVVAARVAKAFLNHEEGVGQKSGNIPRVLKDGSKKVIFLVNKVPLVEQQCSLFKKYMDETGIMGLTGNEISSTASLADMLDANDILVMTAQILVNALHQNPGQGSDNPMNLSMIGLLIFDECHHCTKDDPYNAVMSCYYDLKMKSPESPRPQILGLTASLGVGKATDKCKAENHIMKVCANLDAEDLCIVQIPRNKEELRLKRDKPQEEIFSESRRKDDGFVKEMNYVMEEIEAKISQTPGGNIWMKKGRRPKPGSQEYETWVVEMGKYFAVDIAEDTDGKLLITCRDHLKELNDCLYINRDARTQDAVNHYVHYIRKLEEATQDLNPVEREVVKLFQDKLARFKDFASSQDPAHKNPLLERLITILTGPKMRDPDSRGILFCKTRHTTQALIDWIKDMPSLAFLKPGKLIGGGGSAGLSQSQQEELLRMFREGGHKLIVATSVAEEGLDIQQCNTVIRYNYISNEIGRVQAQGRSRARDGMFYLIVSEELGLADKETKNRIREKMMNQATERIKRRSKKDFLKQIADFQKESYQLRLHKLRLRALMTQNKQLESVQLVCRKCQKEACTLDDLRCIENAHHVVISNSFREMCRLVPHPKPIMKKDFEKLMRIMCGNPKCPQEWGIQMKYKGCMALALTPINFIFKLSNGKKRLFNKWKDMPYKISAMNLEDLEALVEMNMMEDAEEESDDENEEVAPQESIFSPS